MCPSSCLCQFPSLSDRVLRSMGIMTPVNGAAEAEHPWVLRDCCRPVHLLGTAELPSGHLSLAAGLCAVSLCCGRGLECLHSVFLGHWVLCAGSIGW